MFKYNFNLFPNNRKEKETHPDFVSGWKDKDGNIEKYQVSCWKKQGKNGTYMSCVIEDRRAPMEPKNNLAVPPTIEYPQDDINPEDIPF